MGKIKVGISQRSDLIADRKEVRDCLDQQWATRLYDRGFLPIPLANAVVDAAEYLEALQLDAILLTGGNNISGYGAGASTARDNLETHCIEHALSSNIPLLGVCRGAQMINCVLGGSLVNVTGHVKTMHRVRITQTCLIGESNSIINTNSFHNWGIIPDGLAEDLKAVAVCDDGTVEAFIHQKAKVSGILWHPEREKDKSGFKLVEHALREKI